MADNTDGPGRAPSRYRARAERDEVSAIIEADPAPQGELDALQQAAERQGFRLQRKSAGFRRAVQQQRAQRRREVPLHGLPVSRSPGGAALRRMAAEGDDVGDSGGGLAALAEAGGVRGPGRAWR